MKTSKIYLWSILIILISFSCEKMDVDEDVKSSPIAYFDTGSDALDNNYSSIKSNLELIQLGLVDLMGNNDVRDAIVSIASTQTTEDDYIATCTAIKNDLYADNINLLSLMQASILANGGNSTDASNLASIYESFTFDGVSFVPYIYFPFMDGGFFTQGSWDEETPIYVSTLLSEDSGDLEVLNSGGTASIITEAVAKANPIWLVGFLRVGTYSNGDPAPHRFWHLCRCNSSWGEEGWIYTCGVNGENAACGRTGLFNNSCSGGGVSECKGG